MKKISLFKVLFIIFGFVFVCLSLYYLYDFVFKAPRSEYAVKTTCEEKVSVKGYFLREESVIDSVGSKYFDIIIPSGGKVSKGGTIANVYSTDNAAHIQSQIRELESQIDEYEAIMNTSSQFKEDVSYDSEIRKNVLGISYNANNKKINDAFSSASDFYMSVIKNKISLGEISDYSQKINELEAKISDLKKQSSTVIKYISAPVSGYFSQKVDGLENKLSFDMLNEIDSQKFQNIEDLCSSNSATQTSIGKVVHGSEWRLCFKANADDFPNTYVGSSLYIRLPSVTDEKIKCSVIDLCKENENIYIVLQSNMVTGDLISQRSCDVDIIIDSHSGLRIDKNAIRKVDGVDGVFIKSNGIIKYRKINVIYLASTYAVVKYDPLDNNSVQAFDEVIIRGYKLKNKKVA